MKVAVTTPTGNIGKVVTDRLLQAGADVTLLVRDPAKVKGFTDRGARAVACNLEDGDSVTRATRGAECLFWLTPPNYAAPAFRAYQNRLGRAAAGAVKANGIRRVVHLSSVGAHLESGTGPILGLHDTEQMLAATGASVTNLRPGMFMENHLASLPTILQAGSVFLPVPGGVRANFIATRDVGAIAAARILDAGWSGRHDPELRGPEDLTFDEVAAAIGEALGTPVRHVQVGPEQLRDALAGMGASPDAAKTMAELFDGIASGRLEHTRPPSAETTGATTFAAFAREVMAPAARAAAPR
jgi:uncharacterized protein YbjT (DUF2867 family)